MRILHVEDNFSPLFGYQINFLSKWNSINGHQVIILTTDSMKYWSDNGFISNEDMRNVAALDRQFELNTGVKVVRMKSMGRFSGREIMPLHLESTVKELNPDCIFAHGCDSLTGMRLIMGAERFNCPIITDNHMAEVASQNRYSKAFRRFYSAFVTPRIIRNRIPVIALGEDIKKRCNEEYRIPLELLSVVSWGVDTEMFRPDLVTRGVMRNQHNISEADFVCIYTGKLIKEKKVRLLVDAFSKKFSSNRNAVLLLVGSGEGKYYEDLMTLIEKSENRVIRICTQPVSSLAKYYQMSDIACWPGACSLSFFDAQACGLPVIAENIDANRFRINYENDNGIIFESDNISSLRAAIEELFSASRERIFEMSRKAQDFVTHRYSYEIISQKIERIIQNEITRKGIRK